MHLLGKAFLANAIPPLVHSLSGKRFPTPFAQPPGEGESPAWMNAVWGLVNRGGGYALAMGVGTVTPGFTRSAQLMAIGFGVTSLALAYYCGKGRNR